MADLNLFEDTELALFLINELHLLVLRAIYPFFKIVKE